MAIIQTIRDKYAKVAGALIILALIGFVLTDLGKRGFSGSTTAAKVEGQKIDIQDLIAQSNERIEQQRMQMGQPLTPMQEEQLKEEVFNQMVADILFADWQEKLGVTVSEGEFKEMFTGVLPDENVQQIFTNPETGDYDVQEATARFNELEKTTNDTLKRSWQAFKKNLITNRVQTKINNLIAAAMYAPQSVLDLQYNLRNEYVSADFVMLPYAMIPDDKVTVSDEEINAYIQANKNKYIVRTPILEMDVVKIPIVPSAADSMNFYHTVDSLKAEFAKAENPEEFASLVSGQTIQAMYYTKDMLGSLPNAEELMNASAGTMVGPFNVQNNAYAVARILEKSSLPDSIEVRHILISIKDQMGGELRTEEEAKHLIDSLAAAIKAGANFDTLAAQFSDDPGSAQNGGRYTFTAAQKSNLTKAFGDFAFYAQPGESKVVLVDQNYKGYHYIEVLKRSATTQPVSKMVLMFYNLETSEETKQALNTKASQFAIEASKGGNSFDKEAQRLGLSKIPVMANPNSKLMGMLGVSGELVTWASKANIGDVSAIMIVDESYVIAKLTNKIEKGQLVDNESVRNEVANILRNRKKSEMLINEYAPKGDLTAISAASQQELQSTDSLTFFSARTPVLNPEARVLGYVYSNAYKQGSVAAIPGNQGVFFVKVNSRTPAPSQPRDIAAERKSAVANFKANGYRMLLTAMMQKADIDDRRNQFLTRGL